MVVTLLPDAWPASTVHDFTARPSIWTTQAPHWLVSQPTWVPVDSGFHAGDGPEGSVLDLGKTALPFTISLTVDTFAPPDFL
jgi:hypothetical protein